MATIKERKAASFIFALATAIIGGLLFKWLHIPVPWLLGPMIAALIGSKFVKGAYEWPSALRSGSMITVGYTIGLSMTAAALQEIGRQLPYMLLMTGLLLLYCAGIAYIVSKISHSDYKTALMGSIPGGLTQVIVLAEETKGVDITVVTVTQVMRLMMIVVGVPLIVFSPILGNQKGADSAAVAAATADTATWSGLFPNLFLFAAVSIALAWVGGRIKFPTALLLGPLIGTAALQLMGIHGPELPTLLVNAAQLVIGVYVGRMLKPGKLPNKLRTLSLAAGSGLMLIAGAFGFSFLLQQLEPGISASTGLLSLAPGGMDQMGIIAHEIGADLSIVAGYQLFRTFFIFLALPPLWRLIFKPRGNELAGNEG